MMAAKLEETEAFLLRISKNCFFQGIHQAAFYHRMPINDGRYDVDKDVVSGKLVSVGGDDEDEIEGQGENQEDEGERSIEEVVHST